jgi:anti-sigma factor RsiW
MTTPTSHLIKALLGPAGHQIGCDECFELLDAYVEVEVGGDGSGASAAGMRRHLEGCPACHEEYESLRELVTQAKGRESHA